jgi:hypothetical protein
MIQSLQHSHTSVEGRRDCVHLSRGPDDPHRSNAPVPSRHGKDCEGFGCSHHSRESRRRVGLGLQLRTRKVSVEAAAHKIPYPVTVTFGKPMPSTRPALRKCGRQCRNSALKPTSSANATCGRCIVRLFIPRDDIHSGSPWQMAARRNSIFGGALTRTVFLARRLNLSLGRDQKMVGILAPPVRWRCARQSRCTPVRQGASKPELHRIERTPGLMREAM